MTKWQRRARLWPLALGIWTVVAVTFAALQYWALIEAGRSRAWGWVLGWHLVTFYLWAALSLVIVRLARRFPVERHNWQRHLPAHIIASLLLAAAHVTLYVPLQWWFDPQVAVRFPSFAGYWRMYLIGNLPIKIIIYAIIVIVTQALDYHRKLRAEESRASELKAQLAEAQLQALKMQLHPHFLFNTLNAISELVYKDPAAAEEMITRLSDLLRLTLENGQTQEVSLKQELEFLERYLRIEQTRFQDRLTIKLDVEADALDARVPNMILQPLVENAIKHGTGARAAAGRIEIQARRDNGALRLSVRDNGPGLKESAPTGRSGVGLSNTQARLQRLYGAAHSFELRNRPEGGLAVNLMIPFIEQRREASDGDSRPDR